MAGSLSVRRRLRPTEIEITSLPAAAAPPPAMMLLGGRGVILSLLPLLPIYRYKSDFRR